MRAFLDTLPETARPRLWLSLLCLLLWLPGFFAIPPGDRDESRFAQASRQMVDSGDYVRLRLGEEERNKKPVGIHWAQAAAVHVLEALDAGTRRDIWAYRVPSLLGAWLAVLATFHWGRALVGRRAAFIGAALLAACVVLTIETHIAKTDAALLATIVATMGLFGRAYLAPGGFTRAQAIVFWLIQGIAILLKGPIGPMVALLAGLSLFIADRGWRQKLPWLRALRPAWGVPLMLTVALPWLVAIGIATEGRFFAQAVGSDMLGKVGSGDEKHWGPPGYYIAIFGAVAFPGAVFVLWSLGAVWRNRLQPATRFLLAWAAPTWLLFEAVATKLPHYTLPTFPALMLLAGAWGMDPLRRPPPAWLRWLGWLALYGIGLGIALAAAVLPWLADGALDPAGLLGLPAVALLLWQVTVQLRAGAFGRAALVAALLMVPVNAVLLQGVLPRLEAPWIAPRVAALLPAGLPTRDFGVAGYHEPSLLFATGGDIALLRGGADAAAFLAAAPGRVVAVDERDIAAFRAAAASRGLALRERGTVAGFNYSRGRRAVLTVFEEAG